MQDLYPQGDTPPPHCTLMIAAVMAALIGHGGHGDHGSHHSGDDRPAAKAQ